MRRSQAAADTQLTHISNFLHTTVADMLLRSDIHDVARARHTAVQPRLMKKRLAFLQALRERVARLFRRPAPGRFVLRQGASVHGFINVAPAPPWRDYLLYLPRGMEKLSPRQLLVWIHGCRQDPEQFAAGTGIARAADERGFVVLLPRQNRLANSERCWNWFDRRTARGLGETAIVAAQTEQVAAKFGVDPKRVYLAGLSSGGTLAATLALRHPALFRAVAIHSALPSGAAADATEAAQAMAQGPRLDTDAVALEARAAAAREVRVPALVVHGSADTTVVPVNAVYLVRQFLLFHGLPLAEMPVAPALPSARVRGLHADPVHKLQGNYYVKGRLAARLVVVPDLAHAWSGGDASLPFFDASRADATRLILDFFSKH